MALRGTTAYLPIGKQHKTASYLAMTSMELVMLKPLPGHIEIAALLYAAREDSELFGHSVTG